MTALAPSTIAILAASHVHDMRRREYDARMQQTTKEKKDEVIRLLQESNPTDLNQLRALLAEQVSSVRLRNSEFILG